MSKRSSAKRATEKRFCKDTQPVPRKRTQRTTRPAVDLRPLAHTMLGGRVSNLRAGSFHLIFDVGSLLEGAPQTTNRFRP